MRFLFVLVFVVAVFSWWFTNQVSNGRRDAKQLDFFEGNPDSPLMNAQFETGYVCITPWLGKKLGWAGEPFQRVLEIDFRLDNLSKTNDILPYTVFKDVNIIQIDCLPDNTGAIKAFGKFENLKTIYVSRFTLEELEYASRILSPVNVRPAE